ncbi:hypothetical protein [Neisseria sp.]|uniref:hypothetical protein n=1 Tax=Neisseria sp. TaxID=192066 RepID=UPI0035A18669
MQPNLANRLPVRVIPIDRDRSDYALSKNRLSDYFLRNPMLFARALDRRHTGHAVRMAAHACGLWFAEWTNPDNGRQVLVVANKDVMPFRNLFERTLRSSGVVEALKRGSS